MASRARPRAIPADFTDFVDDAAADTTVIVDHAPAPPPTRPAAEPPTQPTPQSPAQPPTMLADYRPVPIRARHDGWTAERQRIFLTVLAETGSISQSCRDAGVSSRSAYRLRQRPDAAAFATAWDQALRLATLRLTTIAFERAVKGSTREIWREGELVGQVRAPSDKVLMFLLGTLLPRAGKGGAGADSRPESRLDQHDRAVDAIRAGFPATLAALTDHDVAMVPIEYADFHPQRPGDQEEEM